MDQSSSGDAHPRLTSALLSGSLAKVLAHFLRFSDGDELLGLQYLTMPPPPPTLPVAPAAAPKGKKRKNPGDEPVSGHPGVAAHTAHMKLMRCGCRVGCCAYATWTGIGNCRWCACVHDNSAVCESLEAIARVNSFAAAFLPSDVGCVEGLQKLVHDQVEVLNEHIAFVDLAVEGDHGAVPLQRAHAAVCLSAHACGASSQTRRRHEASLPH